MAIVRKLWISNSDAPLSPHRLHLGDRCVAVQYRVCLAEFHPSRNRLKISYHRGSRCSGNRAFFFSIIIRHDQKAKKRAELGFELDEVRDCEIKSSPITYPRTLNGGKFNSAKR